MFENAVLLFVITVSVCVAEPSAEQIVYPRILEARGLNGEKLLHIRDGFQLSLAKSSVFAEHFIFTEDDGATEHDTAMSGEDLEKHLYHDREHGSSVVVEEVNGAVQVRGILTDALSIEPVLGAQQSEDGSVAHKLSELHETDDTLIGDDVENSDMSQQSAGYCRFNQIRPNAKNLERNLSVEVRIISDRAHNQNKTNDGLIQYFSIVMNKVNQVYNVLTMPSVQFVVVGIVKSASEPYEKIVTDKQRPGVQLDICGTLTPMAARVKNAKLPKAQDTLILVSGLPYARRNQSQNAAGSAIGCAKLCGVCTECGVSVQSVLGLRDQSAAYLIAHELGHLLGSNHEGERPKYSTGKAKNLDCRPGLGRLMRPTGYGPGKQMFSECAIDQIRGCLMVKDSMCLRQTHGPRVI